MPEVEPVCDENRTVQPCTGGTGVEWIEGGWIDYFSVRPKAK
jgi:hypothetical protein